MSHPMRLSRLATALLLYAMTCAEEPSPQKAAPEIPKEVRSCLEANGQLGPARTEVMSVKKVVADDDKGSGFKVILTCHNKLGKEYERCVTLRRKQDALEVFEDTTLRDGVTMTELAEIRVAIREGKPSGPLFIADVGRNKADNTYQATYVTDRHPLGGAGAHVKLWRNPEGRIKVLEEQGFKK